MNVNSQLLNYSILAIYTYNPTNSVTITCGIQPTGVVTMAMIALHNTCNMCINFVTCMPMPSALEPWYTYSIRQISYAHVKTNTCS